MIFMKIKRNDRIKVIAGKNRGKEGKVSKLFPKSNKVVVEGVNVAKKHVKPKRGGKGQKITVAMPFDVSNVMLICPKCNKQARVGYIVLENGEKHRICKKCEQTIES